MNSKTTLKRLEERAARRPQNAFAEYEQRRLDDMTDEQLARELAALERVLTIIKTNGECYHDDE